MAQPIAFLTRFQAELLMNALHATTPASASSLGGCTSGGDRKGRVTVLVGAGFLSAHPVGRRVRYALTPDGRVFAEALQRLEMARDD